MIRTLYTVGVTFVALSVPHFSVILALVGGSTIACTSFIFPPLFYYLINRKLTANISERNDQYDGSIKDETQDYMQEVFGMKPMGVCFKLSLFMLIFVGISGGFCSTYFAFASLVNGESGFTVPCYINSTVT